MTTAGPIHPGEHLAEVIKKELGITQYRLAKTTGVPPVRIHAFTVAGPLWQTRRCGSDRPWE